MKLVDPKTLSRQLRIEHTPALKRRRWMLGLSLVGVAAGSTVALYQMGIIKRLPDYPSRWFDATRVDRSEYGYKYLQTPDALFMIATYATTAILVGAGGRDRAREMPALPVALSTKALIDVATNLFLAKQEWRYNKALCGYCQTATLASIATFLLSLPETIAAFGRRRSRRLAMLA